MLVLGQLLQILQIELTHLLCWRRRAAVVGALVRVLILRNQHADDGAVETCCFDLDDVFVVALAQDLDLSEQAIQRLVLAELGRLAFLHFKNFDSDLFLCFQIDCKFDPTQSFTLGKASERHGRHKDVRRVD